MSPLRAEPLPRSDDGPAPGPLDAARLTRAKEALYFHRPAADALLLLADMAEEAAASTMLWWRRDWQLLAGVLRQLAPSFARGPLPLPGRTAFSAEGMRALASVLSRHGEGEFAGAARLLRRMSAAAEGRR